MIVITRVSVVGALSTHYLFCRSFILYYCLYMRHGVVYIINIVIIGGYTGARDPRAVNSTDMVPEVSAPVSPL